MGSWVWVLPKGIPTELGHRYIFCSDVLYTRILFLTITQPNLLGKNAQSKDTRKLHNSSAAVTLSDRSQAAPTINSDSMHNIYYMHAHSDNQTGRLNLCDNLNLLWYPFHPHVTAVARKRSQSSCQKCRWQVTAKHTYTLRMWLCMK